HVERRYRRGQVVDEAADTDLRLESGPADPGAQRLLATSATEEDEAKANAERVEPGGGLDHDLVPFHDAKARDHPDQEGVLSAAQRSIDFAIARLRSVTLGVGPSRERGDPVRVDEPGGEILPPDRVGHRHDERGRLTIEPAVRRVRSHRLRDVTGPDERPWRGRQPVG